MHLHPINNALRTTREGEEREGARGMEQAPPPPPPPTPVQSKPEYTSAVYDLDAFKRERPRSLKEAFKKEPAIFLGYS